MKYAVELIDDSTDLFVRKFKEGLPFFESDLPIPIPSVGDQVISEDGLYEVIRRQFFYQHEGEHHGQPTATVHLIGKKIADEEA